MNLHTEYPDARTVVFPPTAQVDMILVGCGGTGSNLARSLVQIALVLRERGQDVGLTFVDPDTVEKGNVPRQMFAPAEIGQPKAVALATRFSMAWGLPIRAIPTVFSPDHAPDRWNAMSVVVGCVDGAAGRKVMAKVLSNASSSGRSTWWLDCGNTAEAGQVLIGSTATSEGLTGAFQTPGVCLALPSPALVAPDLLVARPEESSRQRLSCAELVTANLQSLTINQRVAAEAADVLARLLVTGSLNRFATYFDTASGTAQSYYATPRDVSRAIGLPEDLLTGTVEPQRGSRRRRTTAA